jgi:hypothetical protein
MILTFGLISIEKNKAEPIVITQNASLRELSLDDLIDESELIIVGETKTVLLSKWKAPNGKAPKNITPHQILDQRISIFTDSLLSVTQVIKGEYTDPLIRIRSFVGEIEHVSWVNSSEPIYEKGQIYLLFLVKDNGPTQIVDPGDYISVNAIDGVYKIIDGRAISINDEWVLEDLIAYIQNSQ